MSSEPMPLPATPRAAIRRVVREHVFVDERTFLIDHPDSADNLLDDPYIRAAFARDEYMPYWVEIWPAARMLAKVALREPWAPGTRALEVGCGLGLAGVAALARGVRVTFSDYDATALEFAAANARLNGFADFDTLQLDWRHPPEEVQYPVLLASDLLYEARSVQPVSALIRRMLAPDGFCLLTDLGRISTQVIEEALAAHGLQFTTKLVRAGVPGGDRFKGTLYRITQAAEA
jgi:predicted nicotinamide N-methyase